LLALDAYNLCLCCAAPCCSLLQSFSSPGVFVSEFGIIALALASAFLA
jgi:hypothetical protein